MIEKRRGKMTKRASRLRFCCNAFCVFFVAAAVLFVPVAAYRVVYDTARAICHASAYDALRLLHIQKNGIDFYICGRVGRILLAFFAAVVAAIFGAARRSTALSIALYLAAVLLLAGGVQIEENSAIFAAEGMSGYAGFSWCILIDFVVFALVLTAQRLFLRRVYKE